MQNLVDYSFGNPANLTEEEYVDLAFAVISPSSIEVGEKLDPQSLIIQVAETQGSFYKLLLSLESKIEQFRETNPNCVVHVRMDGKKKRVVFTGMGEELSKVYIRVFVSKVVAENKLASTPS